MIASIAPVRSANGTVGALLPFGDLVAHMASLYGGRNSDRAIDPDRVFDPLVAQAQKMHRTRRATPAQDQVEAATPPPAAAPATEPAAPATSQDIWG